jgi:hypothetical protein
MATHVWVKQGRSCLATARAAWKSTLPSSINHKVFKVNSKCLTHSWLVVLSICVFVTNLWDAYPDFIPIGFGILQ